MVLFFDLQIFGAPTSLAGSADSNPVDVSASGSEGKYKLYVLGNDNKIVTEEQNTPNKTIEGTLIAYTDSTGAFTWEAAGTNVTANIDSTVTDIPAISGVTFSVGTDKFTVTEATMNTTKITTNASQVSFGGTTPSGVVVTKGKLHLGTAINSDITDENTITVTYDAGVLKNKSVQVTLTGGKTVTVSEGDSDTAATKIANTHPMVVGLDSGSVSFAGLQVDDDTVTVGLVDETFSFEAGSTQLALAVCTDDSSTSITHFN